MVVRVYGLRIRGGRDEDVENRRSLLTESVHWMLVLTRLCGDVWSLGRVRNFVGVKGGYGGRMKAAQRFDCSRDKDDSCLLCFLISIFSDAL